LNILFFVFVCFIAVADLGFGFMGVLANNINGRSTLCVRGDQISTSECSRNCDLGQQLEGSKRQEQIQQGTCPRTTTTKEH
jgi:hypothetical protein